MEISPRRTMTPRERTILRGVVRRNRPTWIVHVEDATAAPLWMRNELRSWLCREIEWDDDGEPTPSGRELETLIDVLGPNEHEDAGAAAGGPCPCARAALAGCAGGESPDPCTMGWRRHCRAF